MKTKTRRQYSAKRKKTELGLSDCRQNNKKINTNIRINAAVLSRYTSTVDTFFFYFARARVDYCLCNLRSRSSGYAIFKTCMLPKKILCTLINQSHTARVERERKKNWSCVGDERNINIKYSRVFGRRVITRGVIF